jgi:hypothetical protein
MPTTIARCTRNLKTLKWWLPQVEAEAGRDGIMRDIVETTNMLGFLVSLAAAELIELGTAGNSITTETGVESQAVLPEAAAGFSDPCAAVAAPTPLVERAVAPDASSGEPTPVAVPPVSSSPQGRAVGTIVQSMDCDDDFLPVDGQEEEGMQEQWQEEAGPQGDWLPVDATALATSNEQSIEGGAGGAPSMECTRSAPFRVAPLIVKGMRLCRKTGWRETRYGPRRGSWLASRAAKQRITLVRSAIRKQEKVSKAQALAAVFHHLDKANAFIDRVGWGDRGIKEEEQAHASHDLAALPDQDIVYCRKCAGRSEGGQLRKLARQCDGLLKGNRGTLRLLELGIKPGPGARVPVELRLKHCGSKDGNRRLGRKPNRSAPRFLNG